MTILKSQILTSDSSQCWHQLIIFSQDKIFLVFGIIMSDILLYHWHFRYYIKRLLIPLKSSILAGHQTIKVQSVGSGLLNRLQFQIVFRALVCFLPLTLLELLFIPVGAAYRGRRHSPGPPVVPGGPPIVTGGPPVVTGGGATCCHWGGHKLCDSVSSLPLGGGPRDTGLYCHCHCRCIVLPLPRI